MSNSDRTLRIGGNGLSVRMPPIAPPGQLYLEIDGMRVDYTGPAEDLTQEQWLPWTIDLAAFGANLQSVTMLSIGVDGAGALGMLYIDSIRLYP